MVPIVLKNLKSNSKCYPVPPKNIKILEKVLEYKLSSEMKDFLKNIGYSEKLSDTSVIQLAEGNFNQYYKDVGIINHF